MAIAGALAGAAGSLYYLSGNTEFFWTTYQSLPAAGFNGIAVALFKKEIPSKYLNVINGIGFALLMALMLFVTFHDIVKLL